MKRLTKIGAGTAVVVMLGAGAVLATPGIVNGTWDQQAIETTLIQHGQRIDNLETKVDGSPQAAPTQDPSATVPTGTTDSTGGTTGTTTDPGATTGPTDPGSVPPVDAPPATAPTPAPVAPVTADGGESTRITNPGPQLP